MIWRSLPAVLFALAVAVLPQAVLADENAAVRERMEAFRALRAQLGARADDRGPGPPRPELPFKRLDANADGKVALDEIPEGAPERFKAMLKRADRNQDTFITAEEFAAAAKQHRPFGPTPGSRRPGPPAAASRRPGPPGPPVGEGPLGGMGPPFMRGRGDGPPPFGPRGPRAQPPNPKALFARLDRDKDGKLSVEEFTAGMRMIQARRPPFVGPPGPPMPGRYPGARAPGAPRPFGLFAAEMFKKADANRDGKVALAEVPADRQEQFKRFLARADKDGDKAVSAEEARRAGAAMMARVRAARARRAMATRAPDMARRAAAAGRAATMRREAEARRRPAPPTRAAPAARRPGKPELTPEARKRAAEAKAAKARRAAAARQNAEARKKDAEARNRNAAERGRKRQAPAERQRARKPPDEAESKP